MEGVPPRSLRGCISTLVNHLFIQAPGVKRAWRTPPPRNMPVAVQHPSELVRDAFRTWHADRESLDAELSESLSALSAYQSHLDAWQAELSHERSEIEAARAALESERAAWQNDRTAAGAISAAESNALRGKIADLTSSLLSRTEELRTLDNRRAELSTELELTRAREKDLRAALEEQKRTLEQERLQWAAELRSMRELVERQLHAPTNEAPVGVAKPPAPTQQTGASQPRDTPRAAPGASPERGDSAVLGSIVEQFGKLRQQRASDRQALKRPR